jgi:hypothetical protein
VTEATSPGRWRTGASARIEALRRIASTPLASRWIAPFALGALFLVCVAVYAFLGPNQGVTDGWFPLADSFLHGHLWIDGSRPWIERVPAGPDRYYLPFPPIPGLVLVPVVAVFGVDFVDTSGVTALAGGINVLLVYAMLSHLKLGTGARVLLTLGFAFGTEAFYVAATGGIHLWTETLAVTFLLAALNLALRGKWGWLAGVCFGLAVGCRPSILMGAPAFFVLYWRPPNRRELIPLAIGAATVGLYLAWYNYARFGSPLEFGYALIRGPNGENVLDEPWYQQGIVSPFYLARGLYAMFLRSFEFDEAVPWLQPSWAGTSVLLTMPVLVYLVRARWRSPLVLAGWLGFVGPVALDLMHGNPGFAQFGYRFILDGLPFAWLLLALVVEREGLSKGKSIAIAVGIAVNAYGIGCIAADFMA